MNAGVDDMWLCRACELKEEGVAAPQCCLCPVVGGALKPTTLGKQWCHAACMQWIPEARPHAVHASSGMLTC
jgi:PHD-zinc-finger like domain